MSKDAPPDKREVARSLLLRGSMFVHLDPRVEGVVVPPWLRKQPQLVLQLGLDMVVPIVDLRIDRDGVYGTLSFNRSPFTCIVGWDAIFALSGDDGRGMVWPESMPPEILAEVEREAGRRGPVGLTAVADLPDDDDYDDEEDEYDDVPAKNGKGRPGNVIRLQPKLSALQGGLSTAGKRSNTDAPPHGSPAQAPALAPALAPAKAEEFVRERDTLELVEGTGELRDSSSEGRAGSASQAADKASDKAVDEPAQAADTDGDEDPEPSAPGPRGSHLRLIK